MKKLLDSKFLFILALSLIVLIILGIGAFYLFDDSDATFVRSGYVLNPLSAKNEKYLFNADTSYKENLSQMIVFHDVDNIETTILKESFLHYNDGSMSFLKDGAILDLNSINGKDPVKLYNITSKSIIDKKNKGYVIESNNGDIELESFMGRISDNKYIVAGTLEAKIPGNEKNISGDYFEIVYTEEGVINIENDEVKFQVTAEGSYIYAGDVTIDLGNKKIRKNNEDIMSITSLTISGDENIEIMPKTPDEDEGGEGGEGEGQGQGGGGGQGTTPGDDGQGQGGGNDQQGEDNAVKELTVSLKDYVVRSTSITAVFDVKNTLATDNLTLKVTNLDTGRTIDEKYNVMTDEEIRVPKLSPNTKYLFTVVNERDENKYFQKIFETNAFGVSILKSYAGENELGYKVIVDEGSDITDVRITLKEFDEENNTLTDVKSYQLKNLVSHIEGEHDGISFASLKSDTIYTVVLDNFSTDSTRFNDIYNVSLTTMTLKEKPTFGPMRQQTGTNYFKLYMEGITDKDNAITTYTYNIYEGNLADVNDNGELYLSINKENASPVEVAIGNGEGQLRNDTNYYYKVAIEYFDNEKYVEEELTGSISLYVGSNPYITITKNDSEISYNKIGATLLLTDNSCLVTMPGRLGCDGPSSIQIDVKRRDSDEERTVPGFPLTDVEFDVDGNIIKYDLVANGLEPGKTYVIYVSGEVNGKYQPLDHGEIYENEITTKYRANFEAEWEDGPSTGNSAINTAVQLKGINRNNSLTGEETAAIIEKVIVRLYDGEFSGNLQSQRLIASQAFVNTDEFNIKDKFYDNPFTVTEGIFSQIGDIATLASYNDSGRISEAYTVAIEAFYNVSETDGVGILSSTGQHTYVINPDLYTEIEEPELMIREIYKNRLDSFSDLLTNGETVVGYNLQARFDKEGFDQVGRVAGSINIYVYNASGTRVNFYVFDNHNQLKEVDKISAVLGSASSYESNIYFANGTEYETVDTVMTRGNRYFIGFEITYTNPNGTPGIHPANENHRVPTNYGCYPDPNGRLAEKATPKVSYLYIHESTTDNKMTYNYEIKDIDNALYKSGNDYQIYYRIGDGEGTPLNLTRVTGDVKTFRGSFTMTGLSNGDYYTLYYKKNIAKSGNIDNDVVDYTVGKSDRLFDGYYDATKSQYNFKYEVTSTAAQDNKVEIKILSEPELLKRTLTYDVVFTDTKGNRLEKKDIWQLVKCDDASPGEDNRCIHVGYVELRDMISTGSSINTITVAVSAKYDNGLTGFNYENKVGEGKDYPYMIMQDDSTAEEVGAYIIVNNRVLMKGSSRYPTGYYTFAIDNGYLVYNSKYNINDTSRSPIYLDNQGYYISLSPLNPKMISVDNMTSSSNTFSFSSITPMVKVNDTVSLINGAQVDLALSGAFIDDFCDDVNGNSCVNNNNGTKKMYIEVWDDESKVGNLSQTVIPTVGITLDNSGINKSYTVDIVNLPHGSTYYYNVYVYLNNNGNKAYTRLLDAIEKDEPLTYTFDSKNLDELFDGNFMVTYKAKADGDYNDKELDTKFNLEPYSENEEIPFNFTLSYILCNTEGTCSLSNNIFKQDISDVTETINDSVDISSYDLVFNKQYYIFIYASYSVYDKNLGTTKTVTVPFYTDTDTATVFLSELERPEFVVTRKALHDGSDYLIEFTVNARDTSRVLIDGEYHIELLDSSNQVVGTLQYKDSDGIYRTVTGSYQNHDFSLADATNQTFRITGLTMNTKYKLKIVGDAYMNNSGLDNTNVTIISGPAGDGYNIWTTNDYGVAFGNDVTYGITADSVIAFYPGGSNFENVREVTYLIEEIDTHRSYNGTLTVGVNGVQFELDRATDRWMLRITPPEGMDNTIGEIFNITTSYQVFDESAGVLRTVDYTTYSSLSANRIPYVE